MPEVSSLLPPDFEDDVKSAVKHYWKTLGSQAKKQRSSSSDHGKRSAVTGGKQMDGFCDLVRSVIKHNGMPNASIYTKSDRVLPGYFRPTKDWDLVVVHKKCLVASVEFKSQAGPSFGNNFNNRAEEALGTSLDIWTAYREGAFGETAPRPWIGWFMLLEDATKSRASVGVSQPHFSVLPEFSKTSYAQRYELLLRKLVMHGHYSSAALLLSRQEDSKTGEFTEPAVDLNVQRFLAGLGGAIQTFLASL